MLQRVCETEQQQQPLGKIKSCTAKSLHGLSTAGKGTSGAGADVAAQNPSGGGEGVVPSGADSSMRRFGVSGLNRRMRNPGVPRGGMWGPQPKCWFLHPGCKQGLRQSVGVYNRIWNKKVNHVLLWSHREVLADWEKNKFIKSP